MIVMGVLYHLIRTLYLATAQDIKRLEGISKMVYQLDGKFLLLVALGEFNLSDSRVQQ